MMVRLVGISLSLAVIVATGCGPKYAVYLTTYLSRDIPFPSADQSSSIAVVAGTSPEEPLLEAEIRRKAEHLVQSVGFPAGTVDDCDYFLLVVGAIGEGRSGPAVTMRIGNSPLYYTATSTVFPRALAMTLYERERWFASGDEKKADAVVWRATAASSGTSTDLRSIVDYLLAATFDYFGEDTGKQVRKTLSRGDDRVKSLREAVRGHTQGKVDD